MRQVAVGYVSSDYRTLAVTYFADRRFTAPELRSVSAASAADPHRFAELTNTTAPKFSLRELKIPPTVQANLASRIDRLPAEHKALAANLPQR